MNWARIWIESESRENFASKVWIIQYAHDYFSTEIWQQLSKLEVYVALTFP